MSTRTRTFGAAAAGVIVLGWAVCAWSQATTQPAKDYRIKLSRPEKVGQEFQFTTSGSEKTEQTLTIGEKVQTTTDEFVFEVKGAEQIGKTTEKGEPTEVAFTVETCVKIDGDKRSEAAPKGTVVIVSAVGGKKEVRAKDPGVTLSPDATRILRTAISVKAREENDDDAFGTDKRQRIGDSWPINAELMAKSFSREFGREGAVKSADVTGQTTLAGLKTVEGVECLDLRFEVKLQNFAPPVRPEAKVVKGEVTVSGTEYAPVDESMSALGAQTTMTVAVVMKVQGPNGVEATAETKSERTLNRTGTPVRK
ncbi:MAG: hypothetical protein NTV86_11545 [Planctomycetota bacterium]|nr:hypothetical protein [Planctomycetota bacterium]